MTTFTVITPTLQRKSLIECCQSVDRQTYLNWFHVVMVDCAELNDELIFEIAHPNRKIIQCPFPHKNYGNTCRHDAWEYAIDGSYLVMLDDDNVLAHNRVLEDLSGLTEYWAIVPIMRHGRKFFNDPPGLCMTDTANVIVKREIGRWPNIPDYTADGHWVEGLKAKYPYASYPDMEPIVVMEKSSEGRP